MFSLVSGIYESYWASPQLNLLVVGAQGVGKTTLLERIKVTQFHKKPPPPRPPLSSQGKNQSSSSPTTNRTAVDHDLPIQAFMTFASDGKEEENGEVEAPTVASPQKQNAAAGSGGGNKRLSWVCPAPKRYAKAAVDDDDEDDSSHAENIPGQEKATERLNSMESIDLSRSTREAVEGAAAETTAEEPAAPEPAGPPPQFDVKAGAKMISLHRIRPTIGMNLGKVELCGAKCHFWDLGGRLQDLWERYYLDCDAVIFVWKIDCEGPEQQKQTEDDESDDEIPEITPQLQQSLLEKVRSAIPDDVPFLVLGHVFGKTTNAPEQDLEMNKLYSTSRLLPHYHNPHQAVCLASAVSGQGVRFAMEWLIPLAKRQHRIRDQQQRSTELEIAAQADKKL